MTFSPERKEVFFWSGPFVHPRSCCTVEISKYHTIMLWIWTLNIVYIIPPAARFQCPACGRVSNLMLRQDTLTAAKRWNAAVLRELKARHLICVSPCGPLCQDFISEISAAPEPVCMKNGEQTEHLYIPAAGRISGQTSLWYHAILFQSLEWFRKKIKVFKEIAFI